MKNTTFLLLALSLLLPASPAIGQHTDPEQQQLNQAVNQSRANAQDTVALSAAYLDLQLKYPQVAEFVRDEDDKIRNVREQAGKATAMQAQNRLNEEALRLEISKFEKLSRFLPRHKPALVPAAQAQIARLKKDLAELLAAQALATGQPTGVPSNTPASPVAPPAAREGAAQSEAR